ncbi:MAG: hypothetical protein AAGE52_37795 [Myxococcota bacterium]
MIWKLLAGLFLAAVLFSGPAHPASQGRAFADDRVQLDTELNVDVPPAEPLSCGNGRCEPPEDCNTCPQDCGNCCGNYRCEPPEDCNSCPQDCGDC